MGREADAWALLAHWSGRSDDARRADAERAEATAAQAALSVSDGPGVPARKEALSEASTEARRARSTARYGADAPCLDAPRDPLSVHAIVLDPGHGGDDEGAVNGDGVLEKDVNLALAVELATRLEDFCVVLTRHDDDFVSLADRVRLANEVGADLFVSVHANGSPHREFHGVETYVLATEARRYSTRLREREAEHHGLAPSPSSDPRWHQDVRLLLADLAMRGATDDARRLAERVQASVVERLREEHPNTRDLGVKSALFYVLLGARMPSILVEAGFMTHPEEGRRVATSTYREQVARGMADAIRAFAADRAGRGAHSETLFATSR
jgi:N-acetylmuramoyl-L-alanine amidase